MESHAQMAVFLGASERGFLSVDIHAPACLTLVQKNYLTESFHPTSGTLKNKPHHFQDREQ
tara:strand:- start:146 stop:328 length:183 start_codon:yes stop_codon:yes gene_type:complete